MTLLQIWSLRITNCVLITAPFAKISLVTREHNINIFHLHVHENVFCFFLTLKILHMEARSSYMQITKSSLQSSLWSSDPSHGEQLKRLTLEIQFVLAVSDFKMPLVLFYVYSMKHTCQNNFLCQLAHKNQPTSRDFHLQYVNFQYQRFNKVQESHSL